LKNLMKAGEKPADTPVQTPTKYVLTIYGADIVAWPRRGGNLATAGHTRLWLSRHTTCVYQLHNQNMIKGFAATIQANRQ